MDFEKACYFFSSKVQKVIAPSLRYSQAIYEDVLFEHSSKLCNWLDLGCGHNLLPPWRFEQERYLVSRAGLVIGLDYDLYSLKKHTTITYRVRGDIQDLPFSNDCFDLVTSNMVVEHLRNPESQLREVLRILKPGGYLIFHTPNALSYGTILARLIPQVLKAKLIWFLERRNEEDVFPTYYRANSERTIKSLAHRTGFQVVQLCLITSSSKLIMIPPLAVFELLLIRLLMTRAARRFRTNIIAVLKKPTDKIERQGHCFSAPLGVG